MTAIRLRLRILRNEVPAVLTLWPIADTQLTISIAQWLYQVNRIFPLEAESWGFEHYVVTLGGFECLHYHELGAVFKDEDEVVIRPLQTAEVRARTLLGRDQIDASGRHLYDGLPYGKPLLRTVVRPNVRIPARKRRAVELDEEQQQIMEPLQEQALVRLEDSDDELDDEDSEEDGNFEAEKDTVSESSSDESSSDDEGEEEDSSDDDSSSSSGTSDSSQENRHVSDGSWNGIQSEPPTPPGRKAASRTAHGSQVRSAGAQAATGTQPNPSERSHVQQARDAPQASLKRKAPSDEPAQGPQDQSAKKVKVVGTHHYVGTPYTGQSKTRERNARRRDSKKLAHLKEAGVLMPDADITVLHSWEANEQRRNDEAGKTNSQQASRLEATDKATTVEGKATLNQALGRSQEPADSTSEAPKNNKVSSTQPKSKQDPARLEEQRQQLLGQIASGGVEVTTNKGRKRNVSELVEDEAPEEMSTKQSTVTTPAVVVEGSVPIAPQAKAGAGTNFVPSSVERRSKLDLASSKRLLFGSLGVRVPKTQDERDALQKELSDRAKQRAAPSTEAAASTSGPSNNGAFAADIEQGRDEEDPGAWREKIELTAVECSEEGVTLSTPPFPFYQRWDPQQRRKKSKARTGKAYAAQKRGGKDVTENGEFVESYDKYNQNGEGDALDYDDAAEDEEYWEEGALLNGTNDEGDGDAASRQLLDETMAQEDDDFPVLPTDVTSLPLLAENDARKTDYITYKELTCSAATKWQPLMLSRSAQLQQKSDDGSWALKLAMRDLHEKEVDEEGKRVYSKFEMEGMSDDGGEDERVRTMQWSEMVEPRLLLRGGASAEGA
ncbi:hypothetical protein LTR08_006222 [Meristemomyces frigidus]|nr:hypothetical protein LTR08_006222 [Meristemomyces frigidus]